MIQSIWVKSFRCLNELLLEFNKHQFISIISKNNVGKTSVLEACYILGNLKSFVSSDISHVVPFHHEASYMGIKLLNNKLDCSYYLKIDKDGKKFLNLNQEVVKRKSLVQSLFRTSYISSDSLWFVNATPGYKRNQINTMISQISESYRQNIGRYRQLINHKNKLLKLVDDSRVFNQIHAQLAPLIINIYKERVYYISILEKYVKKEFHDIKLVDGEFSLKLITNVHNLDDSEHLVQELGKGVEKEKKAKVTLYGPHRDDLQWLINGRVMKDFYSRGICRALAYLVHLAQAQVVIEKTQLPMLLLLDEPYSELHLDLKSKLIKSIPDNVGVIYTSTQQDELTELVSSRIFDLRDGVICKI